MPYIRMKVTVLCAATDDRDAATLDSQRDFYFEVDAFGTDDQRHKDALTQFHSEVHLVVPSDFDYKVTTAPYSDPDFPLLGGQYSEEDEPEERDPWRKAALDNLDLAEEEEPEEPVPNFWYLNVYLEDRAYGGPEEGGWWYSCGVPAMDLPDVAVCYGPYNNSEEDQYKLHVQRDHVLSLLDKHNAERRSDLNSVLSEGCYIVCREAHIAKHWPETRPYYE